MRLARNSHSCRRLLLISDDTDKVVHVGINLRFGR